MTVSSSAFANLSVGGADPIMEIMQKYSADPSPKKLDVSVGVYKGEDGECFLFPSVKKAKELVAVKNENHNYTNMAGIPAFTKAAKNLVFESSRANEGKISSLQTISGTGAVHMASVLVRKVGLGDIYVGTPAWGNYIPIVKEGGNNVQIYSYYDEEKKDINFSAIIESLKSAPAKSAFILQACCHNPTGADLSEDQWKEIAVIMKERNLFPIFDIAYLGLGSGSIDDDAWSVRYFYDQGFEMMVCQSYSKNMGLYSERVGCLHVVSELESIAAVQSLLVSIFRSECSFAPAFGARIAIETMNNLETEWKKDVSEAAERLKKLRASILEKFVELKTPGKWDHVTKQSGLFWFTGLNVDQINRLREDEHVYMTLDGRANVAGLSFKDVDSFCESVDRVVRN